MSPPPPPPPPLLIDLVHMQLFNAPPLLITIFLQLFIAPLPTLDWPCSYIPATIHCPPPHSWLTLFLYSCNYSLPPSPLLIDLVPIFLQLFIAPLPTLDWPCSYIPAAIHCPPTLDWPCSLYSCSYSLPSPYSISHAAIHSPPLWIDLVHYIHAAIHCPPPPPPPLWIDHVHYIHAAIPPPPHFELTLFTILMKLFIPPPPPHFELTLFTNCPSLWIDLILYIHAAINAATSKKSLPLMTVAGLACGIGGIGYCLVIFTPCIINYCIFLRKMNK